MNSSGIRSSLFLRALAAFRVLMGLGFLVFVAFLVSEFWQHSFILGAVGVVILLSLKGWLAVLVGYRVLRHGRSARIRPTEWTAMGIGYCAVAAIFLVAAFAGDGWSYSLFAVFFATIAPVWFLIGRRAESDTNRATHSNSPASGDAL